MTDLADGTLSASKVGSGIDAAKVGGGDVSNTEFDFLNGVTSGLQSQLDGKQASNEHLDDLADDGTLSASKVGSGIDAANIADGTVSDAEYQRLDGLTGDIQGQIDGKVSSGEALDADDISSLDNIVIGGTTPAAANFTDVRLETGASGATSITHAMSSLALVADTMNTTDQYTPALFFGSTDDQLTSFSDDAPKMLAGIVGRATEAYDDNTDGGMALDFMTSADDTGATTIPSTRMTIAQDGVVNILNTTDSTTKDTGALIVEGGVGVENNITAGGDVSADNLLSDVLRATGAGGLGVYDQDGTDGLFVEDGGEVGIGTTEPDDSALLDVASTSQGFLPPRMTTAQREAISSPAVGLMVFDTDVARPFVYDGDAATNGWQILGPPLVAVFSDAQSTNVNSGIIDLETAGINSLGLTPISDQVTLDPGHYEIAIHSTSGIGSAGVRMAIYQEATDGGEPSAGTSTKTTCTLDSTSGNLSCYVSNFVEVTGVADDEFEFRVELASGGDSAVAGIRVQIARLR